MRWIEESLHADTARRAIDTGDRAALAKALQSRAVRVKGLSTGRGPDWQGYTGPSRVAHVRYRLKKRFNLDEVLTLTENKS